MNIESQNPDNTINLADGPAPLPLHHFPTRFHAFVWRNWFLVSADRMAEVAGVKEKEITDLGKRMGLPPAVRITADQFQRSYLTIIRRNWHLLPEDQLVILLNWTREKLTFTLQEDDFFFIKLGSVKPLCAILKMEPSTEITLAAEVNIASTVRNYFQGVFPKNEEAPFQFVKDLSAPMAVPPKPVQSGFLNRFGYAYFAIFGDTLLEPELDPYPEGYLDKMVAAGMAGTWMHIVLSKLTTFPWDENVSEGHFNRLRNLSILVSKAAKHGIGIYLYLNEPRFLPNAFFEKYPDLKGVTIGSQSSLCTSHPDVQKYLVDSIATIVKYVPGLAGFFSITASENHTNCWSHYQGASCPRCSKRGPGVVISELNQLYAKGIAEGMNGREAHSPELIVWDWGWQDGWAEEIVPRLPKEAALMSVSEWDVETNRGGVKSKVGEYSISTIGPGPRATKHWKLAKQNGLKTIAKIQAGNTWEIAAVPYIPAMENVATHAVRLREAGVDGLMLGWTLGGYPSPNLEVVSVIGSNRKLSPVQAMKQVASKRFGSASKDVVTAWQAFSAAFSQFPYNGSVVYNAPLQVGPANLLWKEPTGYRATMVGIPYDDVKAWVGPYPVEVFEKQLLIVSDGFQEAIAVLRHAAAKKKLTPGQHKALADELTVAETIAIHYRSIVNQSRFVALRDRLGDKSNPERQRSISAIRELLLDEITLTTRMNQLQNQDSRLGYEATNHYFFTPIDLVEKVLNCHYLLEDWLPKLNKP